MTVTAHPTVGKWSIWQMTSGEWDGWPHLALAYVVEELSR